jgi:hypothetical protein
MSEALTTQPISDETLMRFADGDLPPVEQALVAAAIAGDPELAKRLEPFRFTRERLARAYDVTLEIPEQLINALPPTNGPTLSRPILWVLFFRRPNIRRGLLGVALLTLLTSAVGGWLLRDGLRPHQAGAIAAMQRALDETPSHSTTRLENGTSMKLTSTFASIQKRWCREYVMLYSNSTQAAGVACRGANGIWKVEIQQDPVSPSRSSGETRQYEPAGEGQSERQPVADYRNRIFQADASQQDEELLIAKRWNRQP